MKSKPPTMDDNALNWAKRFQKNYGDLTLDDLTVEIAKPLATDLVEGFELMAPYLPELVPETLHIDWRSEFRSFGHILRIMFASLWSELLLGRGLRIVEIQQIAAPELSIRHVQRMASESPFWLIRPDPDPPRHLPCSYGARPRKVDGRFSYYRLALDFDSAPENLSPFWMSQPLWVLCETFREEIEGLDLSSAGEAMIRMLNGMIVDSSDDFADMIVDQADALLSIPSRMRSLATDNEQLMAIRHLEKTYSEFRDGVREEMREQLIRGLREGWKI